MRRGPRYAVLGMMALLTAASCAEPTGEAEIEVWRLLRDRIIASGPELRGVCAAQLAEGVHAGLWSEEEMQSGADTLRAIFDGKYEDGPLAPARSDLPAPSRHPVPESGRWSMLGRQLQRTRDPAPATAVLFDWLEKRVFSLDQWRVQAALKIARLSIASIEGGWLAARSEAELRPTFLLLQRAQADSMLGHSQQWRAAVTEPDWTRRNPISESLRQQWADPDVALLIEFWCLIGPSQPLFLPAEDADFESYATFCLLVDLLRKHVPGVLGRPAVVARRERLRARFAAEVLAFEQSLDEAILQDLPAAEFARRLDRLATFDFVPSPDLQLPRPRYESTEFYPSGFQGALIDYRHVVVPKLEEAKVSSSERSAVTPAGANPSGRKLAGLPPKGGDYAAWQALRMAEASGSPAERAALAEKLRVSLPSFRPAVARHLRQKLERVAAAAAAEGRTHEAWKPPVAAADADPVAVFVAALESFAAHARQPEIERFIEAWRASRAPIADLALDKGAHCSGLWSPLLTQRGAFPLAEMRERATLALLDASIDEAASVEAVLRARLDAAILRGDLPGAARLVFIAHIGTVIPPAELGAYGREIEALRAIDERPPAEARATLLQIIRESADRSTGVLAAQRLRRSR